MFQKQDERYKKRELQEEYQAQVLFAIVAFTLRTTPIDVNIPRGNDKQNILIALNHIAQILRLLEMSAINVNLGKIENISWKTNQDSGMWFPRGLRKIRNIKRGKL